MCDTFGVLGKHKIFGKNSDRSPNEIQKIEYIKGYKTNQKDLKLTYITIPQVTKINSILISRPKWMWGAEMGVNEYGLVIGNEAIFTRGKYNKKGITGMDIVRLCLERCNNSKDAVKFIKKIINEYEMGGNCGYDHNFYYDNSFLIMDRNNLFVVEVSKKDVVVKEKNIANISNCLTLESNIKEDKIYKYFSGSKDRLNTVKNSINKSMNVIDAMNILRSHNSEDYLNGSVRSVCMHAGKIIGDHTANSMIVELLDKDIVIYTTMGSLPCLSVYKKGIFGKETFNMDDNYYVVNEIRKRRLFNKNIR